MAIDRVAARAAGYTDAEIDAYEAEQKQKRKQEPEVTVVGNEPPPPPPPSPTQGEAGGTSAAEVTATLGAALPDVAGDVAKYGGAAYGAYKVGQYLGSKADLARAQAESVRAQMPSAQRTFNVLQTPEAQLNAARGPVAPTGGAPTAPGPVAPQGVPTQPTAQAADLTSKIRQFAAEKVLKPAQQMATQAGQNIAQAGRAAAPYLPAVAKAGVGLGALLTPGNVGQNYPFPTSGPMRGMEINPQTGRPWTPEELAAYNAMAR